jgi:hypothetical protein
MAPAAIGGTSGPVAPQAPATVARPSFAPAAKFNPDNQLPATAMHKGRGYKS